MIQYDVHIPMFFLQIFSQAHTAEMCLQPCQSAKFSISSPHILPEFSFFQPSYHKKLIDKPVWFWFHEQQMVSNLHRRPDAGIRP